MSKHKTKAHAKLLACEAKGGTLINGTCKVPKKKGATKAQKVLGIKVKF